MATNNYFKNFNSQPQQQLLDDLSREVIQMSGTDVLYLPRTFVKNDQILGEDQLSKFTQSFEIEMYINSTDAYTGGGDQLTRFGLDVQDEIMLTVNRDRFKEETMLTFPKEGDLIYIPLTAALLDIKFVEDEQPFYALGKNYVFQLTCEKFQYSNEKFEIPAGQMGEIFNKFVRKQAVTIQLQLNAGSDKYVLSEVVYQGTDIGTATATGKIASWDSTTNVMNIYDTSGTFVAGSNLKGATNNASRNVTSIDDQVMPTVPFSANKEFETEGDNILDFSELDPWSEGDL